MSISCPKCQHINTDESEECTFCGAVLAVAVMAEVEAQQSPAPETLDSEVVEPSAIAFLEVEGGQEIFFRGAYTTKVPLKAESILVGRRDVMASHYPDIDLMMYRKLDPAISRRHLRFFRENGAFFIEDLCNNNATFLNDYTNKLNHERRELKHGDRIFVSMSLALQFRVED